MCQFTYYKEEEKGTYFPQLYCHITNGFCLYRKKCLQEGKYILIDGDSWKDCYIMNEYLFKQEAPEGAYKVVAHNVRANGKVVLYVRKEKDKTIKVDIPNGEVLEYVYLDENDKAYVEKPKKEEPKVEVEEPKKEEKKTPTKRVYKKKK